jgi:K+-sensing histidine kinase KdpD
VLWADAAHDLRQPVQAALLVAKMLERGAGRAEQQRAARHVVAALSSLGEMLEVLALLSRIESGRQTIPLRALALSETLEPAMREMAGIAKGQRIRLRLPRLQGVVRSNANLLVVAARSLLLNAMKLAGSEEIEARCRRRGSQQRLEVHFRGDAPDGGIRRSAFIQLPPAADRPGTGALGLGLALLEPLCHRLGHNLHYARLPGDAQLLAMELPLVPGAPQGSNPVSR